MAEIRRRAQREARREAIRAGRQAAGEHSPAVPSGRDMLQEIGTETKTGFTVAYHLIGSTTMIGGGGTILTYPDAHPEVSGVDGYAGHLLTSGYTWAALRGAAGSRSGAGFAVDDVLLEAGNALGTKWEAMNRGIIVFDISSFSGTAASATIALMGNYKYDGLAENFEVGWYSAAPASTTAIANGDYDSLGDILFSDTIAYSSLNDAGWNTWTLNAAGLAYLNAASGTVALGIRFTFDADNQEPNWVAGEFAEFVWYTADNGSDIPVLSITF